MRDNEFSCKKLHFCKTIFQFDIDLCSANCYHEAMNIHFDVDKLQKVMTDFYTCTNMTITLFDRNLNCITHVGEWQPYCLAIGNNPELLAKCSGCNRDNSAKSLVERSTLKYTCHAGLAEVVTPIFQNDRLIAYLMIGKFRDAEEQYSSKQMVLDAVNKYGLDGDKMLTAYYQLPVLDKSKLDSAIALLQILIYYITNEKFFRYDHSVQFESIDRYIEDNLDDKITVEDISNHFRIPRHLLYAMFYNESGESVQEYVIKKRISKAQQLLTNTDLSVNQISNRVGYPEYNYFFRIFKERIGTTPLKYRKQTKQHNKH